MNPLEFTSTFIILMLILCLTMKIIKKHESEEFEICKYNDKKDSLINQGKFFDHGVLYGKRNDMFYVNNNIIEGVDKVMLKLPYDKKRKCIVGLPPMPSNTYDFNKNPYDEIYM